MIVYVVLGHNGREEGTDLYQVYGSKKLADEFIEMADAGGTSQIDWEIVERDVLMESIYPLDYFKN